MQLFNRTDLTRALNQTREEGLGVVPAFIERGFLRLLTFELEMCRYYESTDEHIGEVHQSFSRFAFREIPDTLPKLRVLKKEVQNLFKNHSLLYPTLGEWNILETVVQKYSSPENEVSTHRDLKRHPYVIVLINVTGSCDFEVLASKEGPVTKVVRPLPGDMLILRAPGFSKPMTEEERPYHRVSGNTSPRDPHRISIGFRDNLHPDKPFSGSYFKELKNG